MDEKFRDARSEKTELDEYRAPQQYAPPQYAPPQRAPQQYAPLQFAPDAGPSTPPSYAPASTSSAVPPDVPTNGVNVSTVFETIRGSWLLDPLAAQSTNQSLLQLLVENRAGRRPRRFHNITTGAPTAKLDSRRGNIFATLRVEGELAVPATATIRSTTRTGNIVLELVYKSPSRTVNFDAYSRTGNISLLIPRSFSGLVELRGRRGDIELLPALAAFARVERATNSETVVLIGGVPLPTPGLTSTGDLARLYSHSGRLRLGFIGEDSFTEGGSVIGQIFQRLTA
ncbi:hypothetical protein EDB92DRAFT_1812530 [Lactarius akahatsu]|uniref:DUF7330 domain-containing protein n=1 Tax=Lactarius akahatsu TaxID=416441 RepID=A0AAD4LRT7_9AGAM|nr:hypothetical protein EDB92DRAFT_1812530 [Lactarius akahatsu]